MKRYRTEIVPAQPAKEVQRFDGLTCDLCKKEFDDEWNAEHRFDVLETEVSMTTGSRYPDGWDTYTTTFDICPGCFKTVLVPLLKEKGAEPREEESVS